MTQSNPINFVGDDRLFFREDIIYFVNVDLLRIRTANINTGNTEGIWFLPQMNINDILVTADNEVTTYEIEDMNAVATVKWNLLPEGCLKVISTSSHYVNDARDDLESSVKFLTQRIEGSIRQNREYIMHDRKMGGHIEISELRTGDHPSRTIDYDNRIESLEDVYVSKDDVFFRFSRVGIPGMNSPKTDMIRTIDGFITDVGRYTYPLTKSIKIMLSAKWKGDSIEITVSIVRDNKVIETMKIPGYEVLDYIPINEERFAVVVQVSPDDRGVIVIDVNPNRGSMTKSALKVM